MRENEDSFNTFIQLEQYKDLSIYDKKEEFFLIDYIEKLL